PLLERLRRKDMDPKARVMSRLFSLSAMAAFVLAGSAALLVAQSRMSTITGLISDPQHLPVPGSAVSVINEATGVIIRSQADSAGMYRVENLIPGSYRVEVSSPGFKTVVRTSYTQQFLRAIRRRRCRASGDQERNQRVSWRRGLLYTRRSSERE